MVLSAGQCCPNGAGTSEYPLSGGMRELCNAMWRMGYGMVVGVRFRGGTVLDDPSYEIIRRARTTESPWPNYSVPRADFVPKREHFRLIEELEQTGIGTVDIKVVNGLPVDLEIKALASV